MAAGTETAGIPTWMRIYVEAWNSHDPAKVLACMTEDVLRDDKGLGERLEGADAVRQSIVDTAENFSSDYRIDLGELILATDAMYAAEWTMSGTNDREDKARGLPNTGRQFRIQGLSIGRLRDGKVAEERLYYNMADYLTQIGLMPQAPAPATV
ncbi:MULTISPECIES: ester cyclase [unclassified Geodermatophilus]